MSTNKEKGKNYIKLLTKEITHTYKPEAVGSANFFAKQHKFQHAADELGYQLPDSHFMALVMYAFDECGHTSALILQIHNNWKKKRTAQTMGNFRNITMKNSVNFSAWKRKYSRRMHTMPSYN